MSQVERRTGERRPSGQPAPAVERRRNTKLDALRGIAALTVFAEHCVDSIDSNVLATDPTLNLLGRTPVRILWSGYEAVIFFFVLSGLVLAGSIYRASPSYPQYLVRRALRIYPVAWLAVGLAVLCDAALGGRSVRGMSDWFNGIWSSPPELPLFLQHLALVGQYRDGAYDPPVWSLIQEMRISILLPFLAVMVARQPLRRVLLGGIVVSALSGLFMSSSGAYAGVGFFAIVFLIGCLLARHQQAVVAQLSRISAPATIGLLILALALQSHRYLLLNLTPIWSPALGTWLVALGSAIVIALVLSHPARLGFLERQPFRLLGQISYSFYLLHLIVLVALIHMLAGHLALPLVWAAALPVSVGLSVLSYRLVETPCIVLGRRLTRGAGGLDHRRTTTQSSAGDPIADLSTSAG